MFDKTNQGQWWDQGWKLVEGCTPVSEACLNCWSMSMEKRFRKETGIVFHPERLERPLHRKKPTAYAIWNDLFHESVPFEWIDQVIEMTLKAGQHEYQILTKRPNRILEYVEWKSKWQGFPFHFYDHNWIGVTAENQKTADERIPILLQIPATVRFVSCEPLLSDIDLYKYFWEFNENYQPPRFLDEGETYNIQPQILNPKIDWIISGPETGPKARPMKIEWIRNLYDQCKEANIPFFDKRNSLGLNIQNYPI